MKRRCVIYYHQPLPLYRYRFSLFGTGARSLFFYSYFYPLYVKLFINDKTYIAVQTETIKKKFSERYRFPLEKIETFFPEIKEINNDSVEEYLFEKDTYNFIYPSMGAAYKEHMTIAYAMERLYRIDENLARQIRIHFTLMQDDNKDLYNYICQHHLGENFIFHGNISHEQVLSMMKSGEGLLFPSVIETLGLPPLEAASLGTSVIANDMEYVHEVLKDYRGVSYVSVHDYDQWAEEMISCCKEKKRFTPYQAPKDDSWKRLIDYIRFNDDKCPKRKVICVLATASAKRGALAIYNQFVHALSSKSDEDEWHIFVDVDMPMPEIPHVHYHICHTKGFGRIWFDLVGFGQEIKRQGITPDVIFSLQNTGVLC